jgi:hypothetical protein
MWVGHPQNGLMAILRVAHPQGEQPAAVFYPLDTPRRMSLVGTLLHIRSCPTQILTRRSPASPDVRGGRFGGASVIFVVAPLTLSPYPILPPLNPYHPNPSDPQPFPSSP